MSKRIKLQQKMKECYTEEELKGSVLNRYYLPFNQILVLFKSYINKNCKEFVSNYTNIMYYN
jgi:hypothetical protein